MKETKTCKTKPVPLTTRQLKDSDIDHFSWSGGKRHIQYLREWIKKSESGEIVVLGLFEDDDTIGLGYVDFERVSDAGTLWALNIREDKRSKGFGSDFMKEFEKVISDRGLDSIELRVEKDNQRAIDLYEKLGYEKRSTSNESWEQDSSSGGIEIHEAQCFVMRKKLGTK